MLATYFQGGVMAFLFLMGWYTLTFIGFLMYLFKMVWLAIKDGKKQHRSFLVRAIMITQWIALITLALCAAFEMMDAYEMHDLPMVKAEIPWYLGEIAINILIVIAAKYPRMLSDAGKGVIP